MPIRNTEEDEAQLLAELEAVKAENQRLRAENKLLQREKARLYKKHVLPEQAEHEKFMLLVENSSDFISMMTLDGQGFYLNQAGYRMVGLQVDVTETQIIDYLDEQTARQYQEELIPTAISGAVWRGETYLRHFETGSLIDVETVFFIITDPETNVPLYFATVQRDITERKRADKKLQEREVLYRTLIETLPYGVQENDTAGVITYTNQAYDAIFGCALQERVGTFIWDSMRSEDDQMALRSYFKTLLHKQPPPTTYYSNATTTDGRDINLKIDWNYKRNVHGELIGMISVISDVTERKQAEKQLHHTMFLVERSKRLLTAVIDATPDWIFAKDEKQRFILVNKSFANALNLSPPEMIGHDEAALNIPAAKLFSDHTQAETDYQALEQMVWQGKTVHNPQQRVILLDGRERIHDLYKISLRDGNGDIFAILNFSRDITERWETQKALQESEARYRLMARNATDMISRHAPGGTYLYVSPACDYLLGYDQEELVGQSPYDLFHPNDLFQLEKVFTSIIDQPEVYKIDYRVRHKDGHYIWFETTGRSVRHPDTQEVTEIVAVSRDITERKKLEQEIEQYHTELEQLVLDRTFRLDLIANLSRTLNAILDVPKLMAELVLQIKNTFFYYHVQVFLVDEDNHVLRMVAGSGEIGQKLRSDGYKLPIGEGIAGVAVERNGSIMCNDVSQSEEFVEQPLLPQTKAQLAVPIQYDEQVVGVLDVHSDQLNPFNDDDLSTIETIADEAAIAIRNAQLLSERQQTIQKLQELDRAKSQFITMMSHELRTPLNAILGFTELLMLGLSGEITDSAKSDLQLIMNNGQHLLSLINDVLDVTQIEIGDMHVDLEAVAVPPVVDDALEATTISLQEGYPVVINKQIASDLPPVYADPTRLKQILLNLLSNAVKFTHEGSIEIKVMLDGPAAEHVRFSIVDTGVGITEENQQQIFDLFRQGDMSDARQYSGIGVGLSICQELVHLHNGKIGVVSQAGVGSEFYFTIPVAPEND